MPCIPAVGIVRHAGKLDDAVDAAKSLVKADDAADAAKTVEKTADAADAGKKIHGNSLDSPKETTVYQLTDVKTGEHLKYGVTSERPIDNRYSREFMKGKQMSPVASGSRRAMVSKERELVKQKPGPLNREPWAKPKE